MLARARRVLPGMVVSFFLVAPAMANEATTTTVSANTTPATEQGNLHKFKPVNARYVRVTMLKNSANPGVHIVEVKVYP